ncbi:WXG100 family type VII secretion target [Streptomyces sp. NPDC060334]|uniref:WXG100 family type VII secretion target n=1 Tax=Streptomyces sp. NPDC060334 TaxID=3347099 RepID=UPI003658907E
MPGFADYSIEQLMAMVANFSPETVEARGTALVKAAGDIKAIGEILKSHKVSGWEGEASTAFQEWVSQAGSATLRLSEYSATGGKYMVEAGQTMREVRQDMPKRDEVDPELSSYASAKKFHNDPDAQPVARESWRKLEVHRMAAVQQLEKLTTSYKQSAYQMNTAEIPTFPPPPANFVPRGVDGVGIYRDSGGGSGAGVVGSSAYGAPGRSVASSEELGGVAVERPRSNDGVTAPLPSGPGSTLVSPVADRDLNLDLNNVGTLPDKTLPTAPTGTGPAGPGGTNVTPGPAIPPGPFPPAIGLAKPGGGLGPVSSGMFPGTGGLTGKAGVAGLPPRDAGIFGGRPISGGGPSAGIPRGTVIGAEGGQTAGRGMMGGGLGGGAGGSHGASGGSVAGRRLATETGGVAGGRPSVAGGRSTTGGQPFTQGGSGLVRGATGGGPVGSMGHGGAGAQSPGKRRDGQGGERPDYLAEDEETWQDDRRVVPPVID